MTDKLCARCNRPYDAAYDACPFCAKAKSSSSSCLGALIAFGVVTVVAALAYPAFRANPTSAPGMVLISSDTRIGAQEMIDRNPEWVDTAGVKMRAEE